MEKICYKFQGRTVHVVVVKWLPAFTLQCLQTRRLETKGLLVSPPPPLPPDRFFLFNQRVKRETTGEKIGRRAKWWGRVESQKLHHGKSVLGVRAAESLPQGRKASKNALSHFHTASLPFSPCCALAAHLASLCHRAITYIISPKITQSNLYLPTSFPRSLFEICFNK